MIIISEYLFCLLYVIGLFISIYPYLEKKNKNFFIVLFLLVHGLLIFAITGCYSLKFYEYLVSNALVIVCDFFMICIYEKKYSPKLLFYTTFYFCLYMIVVNFFMSILTELGLKIIDVYVPSFTRIVLVFIYIISSILLFKCLEKIKIIPNKKIVHRYYHIFNFIDIIVLLSYIIFFGFTLTDVNNIFVIFILIIFIIIWLCLLYFLNRTVLLSDKNNELALLNVTNKNSLLLLQNYENDKEKLEKFRHDFKNHLLIIRESQTLEEVRKYIDEIINDTFQINKSSYNTGYKVIDTVLSLKTTQYSNINFIVNVDINNLFISQKDIASVLFNLIDNAAENISMSNNNINVEIIQSNKSIVITVTNYVDGKINFVSKKGNHHGYGLKIIKGIAEKYNGEMLIDVDGNFVIIQIFFEKKNKSMRNIT